MHQQAALLLLLSLAINLADVCCDVGPQNYDANAHKPPDASDKVLPVIHLPEAAAPPVVLPLNNATAITIHHNAANATTSKEVAVAKNKLPHASDDMMQSGAIQRAFYVLLGGTVLLLVFLGFRMYRLQRGGGKPNIMVRKYGVLTNRRDVEMLPLPLDEDDEDDTVFEVNNQIENHS